jgi:hypothetical protein
MCQAVGLTYAFLTDYSCERDKTQAAAGGFDHHAA